MGIFGKKTKDEETRDERPRDASVGLYGKHPSASDFLRLNASSVGLRALDAWISEALTVARRAPSWASLYGAGSTLSFVFLHGDAALLGALSPSTDRSGRQFPLVIFSELPLELAKREEAWLPGSPFLDEVASLLARRASLSREALFEAASRLTPPGATGLAEARRRLTRYLEGTSCEAAFKASFGEMAVATRGVAALEEACRAGGGFAVACPLGLDPTGDVALWVRLVQLLGHGQLQPGMLWSTKMLLVFFGRFTPHALAALWSAESTSPELYDLRSVEATGSRGLPGERPLADWLDGLR